jgi:hypothetical protein
VNGDTVDDPSAVPPGFETSRMGHYESISHLTRQVCVLDGATVNRRFVIAVSLSRQHPILLNAH